MCVLGLIKQLSCVLCCLIALAACGTPGTHLATTPSTELVSIPAIQQWTGGSGTYTFSESTRIVEDPNYQSQVNTTAYVLQSDLFYLEGIYAQVIIGSPSASDIYLTLSSTNADLGTEGYSMTVGSYVTISAQATGAAGLFYGTRTLLQYLRQGNTISGCTINDWPAYPLRGLMVDVGDKYFTMQWLYDHIRDISYLKLNTLHLHLSDIYGFRVQSTSHPELNSGTTPQYSHADLATLVQLGQQYQINIIPEIESPSHANAITAAHPELELGGNPEWLDISLAGTYTLLSDLMNEFLPLFPGGYWHEGLDEYVDGADLTNNTYPQLQTFAQGIYGSGANSVDAYFYYADWLDGIIKSSNKTARAWEDPFEYTPIKSTLNTDIALELWLFVNPNDAAGAGFKFSNATSNPLYYNAGVTTPGDPTVLSDLYNNWAPNLQFGYGNGNDWTIPASDPHLQGAKYHIWCNSGDDTETDISNGISSFMRAFAQNSWGSPDAEYSTFTSNIKTIGTAPGFGSAGGPITPGDAARFTGSDSPSLTVVLGKPAGPMPSR